MMRKTLALLALAASSVACGETSGPEELTCPSADAPLCTASAEVVAAAKFPIADVGVRSAKGLTNTAAKTQLETQATVLAAALQEGRVSHAREVLAEMRATIADARAQLSSHPGDAPDLTGIELSLRAAAELLQ